MAYALPAENVRKAILSHNILFLIPDQAIVLGKHVERLLVDERGLVVVIFEASRICL